MLFRSADLLVPDHVAVEAVAVLARGYLEVETVVRQDVLHLAEVELDTRGPQVGPRESVLERLFAWNHPDTDGAGLDELVPRDQPVEVVGV